MNEINLAGSLSRATALGTSVLVLTCALLILFAELSVVGESQQEDVSQATSLRTDQQFKGELKGGETKSFIITLRQGEYLHVLVDQQGIDVIATLRGPRSQELAKVNLYGQVGPEPLSYLASEAGNYRLEVMAALPNVVAGRYVVSSAIKSKPEKEDLTRISAERLLVAASELNLRGGTTDLRRALTAAQESSAQWRELDDKYWYAYALDQMGWIYRNLGDRANAVSYFNQALLLRRKLRDPLGEGMSLRAIGILCSTSGKLKTSLRYFNQALSRFRMVGDRLGVAYTLEDIGRAHQDLNDSTRALNFYEQVLALARAMGDRRQEAVALSDLAIVQSRFHQGQKALQYYEQSLPLWRAAGDQQDEALTLANIGLEYGYVGDKQRARDYYRRALAIYQTLNAVQAQNQMQMNVGELSLALGETESAISSYRQSSQLEKALGDRQSEVTALTRIRDIYDQMGNFEKSVEYGLRILELWRSMGNRRAEAATLNKIAAAYAGLEKYQSALEHYKKALLLWRDIREREGEADTLRFIGGAYISLNEKDKALEPLKTAFSLYQTLGDHGSAGVTLTMMGLDYYFLGDRDRAWKSLDAALPYLRYPDVTVQAIKQITNSPLLLLLFEDYEGVLDYYKRLTVVSNGPAQRSVKPIALVNIGKIHALLEHGPLAAGYFQEALRLFRALGERNGEAATLNEIGKTYLLPSEQSSLTQNSETAGGDKNVTVEQAQSNLRRVMAEIQRLRQNAWRANEFFQQALAIYQDLQDRSGEASTLLNIGHVHQIVGNEQQAFDDFRKALLLLQENPGSPDEGAALYALMDVCTDLSKPELAIIFGKQAVNFLQGIRSMMKALDKTVERAFVRLSTDTYRDLADLLIKQGRLLEAEQVLEMLKEEEFYRFVRRDDQVANELLKRINLSPAEQAALVRYNEVAEKIVALGDEYGKLDAKRRRLPPDQTGSIVARQDEINKDLAAARTTLTVFLDKLKEEFGNQDKRIASVEEGLQAEVKSWNEPHTVVVSTVVGKNSLSMILTTADTQRAFIVDKIDGQPFSEETLNSLIEQFRMATKDPSDDPRPSGQRLYDLLLKPLDRDLQSVGANTIVWSLDANLRYVPMAALYDSQHGYVAERYASVIITLASRSNLDLSPIEQSKWQALGLGVSKPVGGFPALGNVPEELRAIVRDTEQRERTGLLKGHRLLDEQFTLAALKLNLGHFNIIHAATHFSFRAGTREESLESFLLLGSGERLTLAQIKDAGAMFNGVELLVLSACDTAAGGKGADGREVEGFGVLAQKAGARTVMATLWPVADPSTRQLMVKFYELHGSKASITKAEALRRAQMSLLRGDDGQSFELQNTRSSNSSSSARAPYAHPYYWAPFVLIGNWK